MMFYAAASVVLCRHPLPSILYLSTFYLRSRKSAMPTMLAVYACHDARCLRAMPGDVCACFRPLSELLRVREERR